MSLVTHQVSHARLFEEFGRLCDASHADRSRRLKELRAQAPSFANELQQLLAQDDPHDVGSAGGSLTNAVRNTANASLEGDRKGDTVGRFVLLDRLGQGGMGVVYAAFDTELERRVAVKIIRGERPSVDNRSRWLREARAMAKVAHRNVVTIFETGIDGDDVFIAMEQIAGGTLSEWMVEIHATEAWRRGHMTTAILSTLLQAAQGLAAAHAVDLLHRDFKPDNVLIGQDGTARVADFGLARGLDNTPEVDKPELDKPELDKPTPITRGCQGTPAYMSPEQFENQTLDARSDQFSFCVTAYRALFGVPPFKGTSAQDIATAVMGGQLRDPPVCPPVDHRITAALRRGLQRDPAARFASMDALVAALKLPKRRGRLRWLGALGVAAGLGAFGWVGREQTPLDPCTTGTTQAANAWGAAQTAQVQAALTDPTRSYAPAVSNAVVTRLDAYASDWSDAHRDACRASHVYGEQSRAMLDARMLCLSQRLVALRVSVEALATTGPGAIDDAIELIGRLPTLDRCADPQLLQTTLAPPADPQMAIRVAELRTAMYATQAARVLMDGPRALALIDAAIADATTLDYPPVQAELLLVRGEALTGLDRPQDAVAALIDAVVMGQEIGADDVVSRAAAGLGRTLGSDLHDAQAGLRWLRLAEATGHRTGMSAEMEADILMQRAWVLARWERRADAVDVAERAVAAAERIEEHGTMRVAATLDILGIALSRASRFPEAEVALTRSRDLDLQVFDSSHPKMIERYLHLGNVQSQQRKIEPARANLQAAVAIADSAPGVAASTRALVHDSLGSLWLTAQQPDKAYAQYQVALKLQEAALGETNPAIARTLNNIGLALQGLERYDEAVTVLERSLEIKTAAFGEDHIQLFLPLFNTGVALVRSAHPRRAIDFFERGATILHAHPGSQRPFHVANHQYWLGIALYESLQDRARGRSLVQGAKVAFDAIKGVTAGEQAAQWLLEHPG